MHNRRRTLFAVLLAVFIDLLSYGILVPVVPQLLANPASPYYMLPPGFTVQQGYILLGFLIAALPLILFFATPILGQYSDIYGRRKILTLALAGTAVSFSFFAVGVAMKSLTILFASRVAGGIFGGNISVAQAAIADVTPPRERAKNFGLIGAAYGLGFILGPVIGGILSDGHVAHWFNATTPFWFAAALSAANAFILFKAMKETKPVDDVGHRHKISWSESISHIVRAYNLKSLRGIFAANFLFQAGITFFATFFTVFLIDKFKMDQSAIGYYIGFTGLWIIVAQALVVRFLSKRFDETMILRASLIVGAALIFAYYIPLTLFGLLIVGAGFALVNGVSMAVLPSLVSARAPARSQGEILGINGSIQALAQVSPPILSGFLAAQISPFAPIFISGTVILAAWIVFVLLVRNNI